MPVRQPVVAGRFYPGQAMALKNEISHWLDSSAALPKDQQPWAVMLPHAGYVYCGNVMGRTLAGQTLANRLVVLCPNHTGRGKMLGVWPDGAWLTPLGPVEVDTELAGEIIDSHGGFEADTLSHLGEHSIEVLLPFLQEQTKNPKIVPICVGTQHPHVLAKAASALAEVLKKKQNADVGIVVSSDMNHYENQQNTIAKDELALDRACAADPEGLLKVVAQNNITMCGAGPLALALYAARDLGGASVEVVAHETSGETSGDFDHTVGYAGLRILLGTS